MSDEIQIVNPTNLGKIEDYLNDSSYRESIEASANFNTRLSSERRLRLPYFDRQTNVAQNHSNLFMNRRQRMPGFREGQLYTYPINRWRKSRRQCLMKMLSHSYTRYAERPSQASKKQTKSTLTATIDHPSNTMDLNDFNGNLMDESSSLGAANGDTRDRIDSQTQSQQQQQQQQHQQQQLQAKEDLPKECFYDEMELNEFDNLEEPKSPADDEYDFDPRYENKMRKKRREKKSALGIISIDGPSVSTVRRGRPYGTLIGRGRGRGRARGRGRGRRRGGAAAALESSISLLADAPEPLSFEAAAAAAAQSNNGTSNSSDELTYQMYLH